MDRYDDPIDTEEELRETYPHRYGVNDAPYEPPGYKLSPKRRKFLDEQRAKYAEQRRFVEEYGEQFHDGCVIWRVISCVIWILKKGK